MSTDAIQPGDLVCVVRGSCLCIRGHFFRVGTILRADACYCRACAITRFNHVVAVNANPGETVNAAPLEWLQRIPPLSDLEHAHQPEALPHEPQPA